MKMWVARDFGGLLYLFLKKPIKLVKYNCWDGVGYYKIDQDLFPEVTFENSPMKVELKLVNDVQG